jgi:hypothetical protein
LRRSGLHAAVERQRSALRPPKRATVPDEPGQALALCRSVLRALPIRPDDERCLIRSLVLSGLLSKRGIPSSIVIAVRSEPFKAHAWVEYDGRPLLPPAPPPFERLLEV